MLKGNSGAKNTHTDNYRYTISLIFMAVLSACLPPPSPAPLVSCPTVTCTSPTLPVLPTVVTPTATFTINKPTSPLWEYSNRIAFKAPADYFETNSPFEIVEHIFRHGIERYTNSSVPEGQRIIDYKIESIEILNDQYSKRFKKEHPADFIAIAQIGFSVIPARYIYSDWFAGNGKYHPGDIWISGKSEYYAVVEKDGQYILINIGTSL